MVDEKADLALTEDVVNRMQDFVGAVNRALAFGLKVEFRVTSEKIKEGFQPGTDTRSRWLPVPYVTVRREVEYTK